MWVKTLVKLWLCFKRPFLVKHEFPWFNNITIIKIKRNLAWTEWCNSSWSSCNLTSPEKEKSKKHQMCHHSPQIWVTEFVKIFSDFSWKMLKLKCLLVYTLIVQEQMLGKSRYPRNTEILLEWVKKKNTQRRALQWHKGQWWTLLKERQSLRAWGHRPDPGSHCEQENLSCQWSQMRSSRVLSGTCKLNMFMRVCGKGLTHKMKKTGQLCNISLLLFLQAKKCCI